MRHTRAAGKAAGSSLCASRNIFRSMRNPGVGSSESSSMAKTNREEKSCATGKGQGGDSKEGQGEIYPCGSIARVHTWPRAAAAAATDPPTLTGDEKGREKRERKAENRCGASRLSRAREREEGEREEEKRAGRGAQGSGCRDFSYVFALRRFQRRTTLEIEIGIRYATISTLYWM